MINLAEKYSSKIDEIINNGALSESGVNKEYDFVGAQTVKVYSFGTADMNDYKASGDNRYGTPAELEDSLQEMTMSRKRSFTFTIDKTNAVDSPEGVRDAAKALRRQLDLKVIPEIDTYRFAKMADNAGFKYFTAVSSTTAYSAFTKANCDIDNAEMPVEGRIAFATAEFINAVKTDSSFVKSSDIAQNMLIKNQFGEIDGVRIIKVPASRMPAGACFIITNPIATTAPVKLSDYKVHQDPPGLAGNLVEGLTYPYNRTSGVYNGLTVDISDDGKFSVNGTATADTIIFEFAKQSNPIYLSGGVSYTLNCSQQYNIDSFNLFFKIYHADKTYSGYTKYPASFTAKNGDYLVGSLWIKSGSVVNAENVEIQLELGSTPTAYEPYRGSTYTITPDSNPYTVPDDIRQQDGMNILTVSAGELTVSYSKTDPALSRIYKSIDSLATAIVAMGAEK